VWRPSETNGCYDLVGYDRFAGFPRHNGLISKVVNSTSLRDVSVQAGDIVGLFFLKTVQGSDIPPTSEEGIMLDSSYKEEKVWYQMYSQDKTFTFKSNLCPLSAKAGTNFHSAISAGPLLSVSVGKDSFFPGL